MENIVADNNTIDEEDGFHGFDVDKAVESGVEHKNVQNRYDTKLERDIVTANDEHQLLQIPSTEKKKWPQKPCVCCRKHGTRRDTRYICSLCNVALCKNHCFSDYHSCK